MKKISTILLAALVLVGLAACGESSATTAPAADLGLVVDTAPAFDFKYVETTLNANAGEVKLTLKNGSQQPHNWTLVKQGGEDQANTEAAPNGPQYKAASALAQTAMLDAGKSETISFKAEPGTYTYLCTFPGHYLAGMKGTLIVK